MDKLSYDKVKHIANLAKIYLTDEEVEKYRENLAKILDDVSKIKDIDCDEEILIAPVEHETILREDKEAEMLSYKEVLLNVPNSKGNFVEVPVMLNE